MDKRNITPERRKEIARLGGLAKAISSPPRKCTPQEKEFNQWKNAMRKRARQAIKGGWIKREKCFCGEEAQMHHEDYNKPLEVVWLCQKHHTRYHYLIKNRNIIN